MLGHRGGVAALFREAVSPYIFVIHCVAHRLNLASTKVWEKIEACRRIEARCKDLYNFVNKSTSRRQLLEEIQRDLDAPTLRCVVVTL